MKFKALFCLIIVLTVVSMPIADCLAASNDILRQGLLGAGAGAVGGAASGAKGGDVWKGALAGAGVNVVGNALLDSMSGEKVTSTQQVDSVSSRTAYSDGYEDGYKNGYKKGYTDGYKEGMAENYRTE